MSQIGFIFPQIGVHEDIKYLSCHHLVFEGEKIWNIFGEKTRLMEENAGVNGIYTYITSWFLSTLTLAFMIPN